MATEKIELANRFHALFQTAAEVYVHCNFLKALQLQKCMFIVISSKLYKLLQQTYCVNTERFYDHESSYS